MWRWPGTCCPGSLWSLPLSRFQEPPRLGPRQLALEVPAWAWWLDQKTSRGPFQHLPFCDSVTLYYFPINEKLKEISVLYCSSFKAIEDNIMQLESTIFMSYDLKLLWSGKAGCTIRVKMIAVFGFKTSEQTLQYLPLGADVRSGIAATNGTSNSYMLRRGKGFFLDASLYYTEKDSTFMTAGPWLKVTWLSAGDKVNPNKETKVLNRSYLIFKIYLSSVLQTVEALHLGTLMAAHGYFFPISDHVLTLKDDGTFYRFQVSVFNMFLICLNEGWY